METKNRVVEKLLEVEKEMTILECDDFMNYLERKIGKYLLNYNKNKKVVLKNPDNQDNPYNPDNQHNQYNPDNQYNSYNPDNRYNPDNSHNPYNQYNSYNRYNQYYPLPFDIVNLIFKNIPEKERTISFFKTCKYYYEFSHIFYDNHECNISKNHNYLTTYLLERTSKIKILTGVYDIEIVKFTPFLRELTFGASFNKPINNLSLPDSLKCLNFGRDFNQSINGLLLPNSLKYIRFDKWGSFNQPFCLHSQFLEEITFGYKFDNSIDNLILCSSLKKITVGMYFDQERIKDMKFPKNLELIEQVHYGRSTFSFILWKKTDN